MIKNDFIKDIQRCFIWRVNGKAFFTALCERLDKIVFLHAVECTFIADVKCIGKFYLILDPAASTIEAPQIDAATIFLFILPTLIVRI